MNNLTQKQINNIVYILLALMPIIGMCVDLIAPSLPAISGQLKISTTLSKNIISIYLLGYGLGNFISGLLTDSFGRQKLLRYSLIGFLLANLLPIIIPQINIILLARLLQGFTIGSVAVIARTIISDILPADKLIKIGTLIGAMWGIGPVIGPSIGGYLQYYIGWQANFGLLAICAIIAILVVFASIPETIKERSKFNTNTIKNNIVEVISNKLFLAMALMMGFSYALMITFQTSAPFLIQSALGYSSIFFGNIALFLGLVFLISTFVCRFFLRKYDTNKLHFLISHITLIISTLAIIAGYFMENSIVLIITISAIMFFATGFTFPMSMGKGMSLFRKLAGTASALLYLINIMISSGSSFILGFINIDNDDSLFFIYFGLSIMMIIVYWLLVHEYKKPHN